MIVEKIKKDMVQSMKDKDKTKLSTLRLLLSSIETERSRVGIKDVTEFSKDQVIDLINRNIKMLNQEIESIVKVERDATYQEEQREILISYLPKQLTHDEIREQIHHAVALVERGEIRNPMQYLSKKLKGKADMSAVSKIIKEEF